MIDVTGTFHRVWELREEAGLVSARCYPDTCYLDETDPILHRGPGMIVKFKRTPKSLAMIPDKSHVTIRGKPDFWPNGLGLYLSRVVVLSGAA